MHADAVAAGLGQSNVCFLCAAVRVCDGRPQGCGAPAVLQVAHIGVWEGALGAVHVSIALLLALHGYVILFHPCSLQAAQLLLSDTCWASRLPAQVSAAARYLHEEKKYSTLTLLAGALAVPLLFGACPAPPRP